VSTDVFWGRNFLLCPEMLSILNDMFPNRVWDAVEDWYIREGVHHPGDGERGPTPRPDPELEELHPLLCSVNGARLNPSTGGTMKMKKDTIMASDSDTGRCRAPDVWAGVATTRALVPLVHLHAGNPNAPESTEGLS
jgi:hypothetical protein